VIGDCAEQESAHAPETPGSGVVLFTSVPRVWVHAAWDQVTAAEVLLSKACTAAHWRKMHAAYACLANLRAEWRALGRHIDWATAVVLWVAAHQARGVRPSSLRAYTNVATGVLRRSGTDLRAHPLILDLRRALDKLGARRPSRQAVPATMQQVELALQREPREDVRVVTCLMWVAAARCADVLQLQRSDIVHMDGDSRVAVRFAGSKSDPFAEKSAVGVRLPKEYAKGLARLVRAAGSGRLFPTVYYGNVVSALRRVSTSLTAHSIRRGALATLLRAGVRPEEMLLLSRHTSLDGLLRYLPLAELPHATSSARLSAMLTPPDGSAKPPVSTRGRKRKRAPTPDPSAQV
jgi:hypothetical protein